MIRNVTLAVIVCSVLIFLSCGPTQAPAPAAKAPGAAAPAAAQPGGWQQDWEKTLAAAKREGGLTMYVSGAAGTREAIGKAFKEKFGLEIEWVVGQSAQLTEKILAERRAGLYLADVTMGSTTNQIAVLKPQGHIVPAKPLLVLPEVLDKNLWFGGDIPWLDNEKMYVMNSILAPAQDITLNTSMVRPEEIRSYSDLLNAKWKGKFVMMNPTLSVRPFTQVALLLGEDWWRQFVSTVEPFMVDVDRQAAEWIARGKYPLGIVARDDVLEEFIQAGAPVARAGYMKEGNFLGGGAIGTSVLDRAPHPNAAKLYANWYFSKDGGVVLSKAVAGQSARLDVPTAHLRPQSIRDPSVKYLNVETEEFFTRMSQDRAPNGPAMQIFGPLTGRK